MSTITVSQLMQPCAAATITLTTPLREAAEFVLITGLTMLPVVDESGRFTGIVTDTALIRCLMTRTSAALTSAAPTSAAPTSAAPTSAALTVAGIVSHHVQSARCDADLASILPLFRSAAYTTIPVVDSENAPVGLLHRRDVIRYLLDSPDTSRLSESPAQDERPKDGQSGPHFNRRVRQDTDRPA